MQDQTAYDVRWLVERRTGEVVLRTSDLGIDGENPARTPGNGCCAHSRARARGRAVDWLESEGILTPAAAEQLIASVRPGG